MLSKSKAKYIVSLQKKKVRDEERLFIIEGDKLVKEFVDAQYDIKTIIAKPEFIASLHNEQISHETEILTVSYEELKNISTLKTPHNALAIVSMPEMKTDLSEIFSKLAVALDTVQDPGNLGTIIRAAAWFGIKNIICSENCVDVYNPKAVQSSMGALLNVNLFYYDLKSLFISASELKIPVFGTLLEGKSIYSQKLGNRGIILLGNESKGISNDLIPFITDKLMIPKFSDSKSGLDSLNVGMAASVVLSEFARRTI